MNNQHKIVVDQCIVDEETIHEAVDSVQDAVDQARLFVSENYTELLDEADREHGYQEVMSRLYYINDGDLVERSSSGSTRTIVSIGDFILDEADREHGYQEVVGFETLFGGDVDIAVDIVVADGSVISPTCIAGIKLPSEIEN